MELPDSSEAALSWVKRRQIVYFEEFFGELINNKVGFYFGAFYSVLLIYSIVCFYVSVMLF